MHLRHWRGGHETDLRRSCDRSGQLVGYGSLRVGAAWWLLRTYHGQVVSSVTVDFVWISDDLLYRFKERQLHQVEKRPLALISSRTEPADLQGPKWVRWGDKGEYINT